jgi:hypothetical protein
MKLINSTCVIKQEDWWTYELCFSKGVRQIRFNIEQSMNTEGKIIQKQVVAAQFVLGLPILVNYEDEEQLAGQIR